MEIYFNPYPGAAKTLEEGKTLVVNVADAYYRLKNEIQNAVPLNGNAADTTVDLKPSRFILVREATIEYSIKEIFLMVNGRDKEKLKLLLTLFSTGQIIDKDTINDVENWLITSINNPAPILEIAVKNGAIALTIPTEIEWQVDILSFAGRKEILPNLWGQKNIATIRDYCIESLATVKERFSKQFNAVFCNGALNSAPKFSSWDDFGFFWAMKKAKEHEYNVDDDLVKNKHMPKTKKYGSLLELRCYGEGHRIFFVHRKGVVPEILIGGFYQKNQAMSQDEAIQKAKGRIDDYND
ncbi:hypothetical protein ACYULU_03575 [Breznakiellaceae bacterium SP9]